MSRPPKETKSKNRAGEDTEATFLTAAEMLFASRGYEGATSRMIADAAGVNLGALHYYWRSKQGLFKAVCERRLKPIVDERARRFEAIQAETGDDVPDLRKVLEAAIVPVLSVSSGDAQQDTAFGALMARTLTDPTPEVNEVMREIFDETSRTYVTLLRRGCPHLDDRTFYWRLMIVWGGAQFSYSGGGRLAYLMGGDFDAGDFVFGGREIVEFLYNGLMAPQLP